MAFPPRAGGDPISDLGLTPDTLYKPCPESISRVLAGSNVIKPRSFPVHVCPPGIIKIQRPVDVSFMPFGRVGIAHDNSRWKFGQRSRYKPTFGVARKIVRNPQAVKFYDRAWIGRARANEHVTAGRCPKSYDTLDYVFIVKKSVRIRNRRLAVQIVAFHCYLHRYAFF